MATQDQINNLYSQAQEIQAGINKYASSKGVKLNKTSSGYSLSPINIDSLNTSTKPYSVPQQQTPTYGGLEPLLNSTLNQGLVTTQKNVDDAKTNKDSALQDVMNQLVENANISSSVDRTAQDEAKKRYDQFTSQLEQEQLSNRRAIENLQNNNPQGLFGGALQQEVERINRASLSKQADIAILQSAANRDYATAAEIADRQVALKTEQGQAKLQALQLFYQDYKDTFNKQEDRQYQEAIKKADREYQAEETLQNQIRDLKLEGIKTGALNMGDLQKLNNAKSFDDAFNIVLSSWKRPSTGIEAPVVKTINGVDMQWNSTTGQWETIGAQGVDQNQKSIDQLSFLRNTVTRAKELSKASGASGISQKIGNYLVGDTKYNRLQNETDTLRTNILTLMTDPSIKKFFGPQMSNADVILMASAGTTLNAQSQSPKDLRTELDRLDNLFNRMLTAVQNNGVGGNVITAPDGTLIEIVD